MQVDPSGTSNSHDLDGGRRWHSMTVEEALDVLQASTSGISAGEASRRLEEYGPNRLPEAEPESLLRRLLRQFNDMLIYILLVAAVVTALLGEWIDTGVILAVVVINALIGFVQEGKAEAALASIKQMLSLSAQVLRDGEQHEVEAEDLVPGDIVLLESGDKVPADLRLLKVRNLQVEEAALTGESTPVSKTIDTVERDAGIGDRASMVFSGTTVSRGRATGVVVGTGTATEIGRIGTMISGVETLTTPLLRAINRFGKVLSGIILLAAAAAFAFGYFLRDFSLEELFMIIVGLAVAAIPEGLPAIMTITLALGVQRMARHRAILRRLPAVETLGSVTVICSDKTGTLTRNEMTARAIVVAGGSFGVSGTGYAPTGKIELDGDTFDPQADAALSALLYSGVLASDARLRERDETWTIEGDPTEGAFVVLGRKVGLSRNDLDATFDRRDAIPFESENRYMAALTTWEGGARIHVKGGPERVLDMCSRQKTDEGDDEIDRAFWEDKVQHLAEAGNRVLAVAGRDVERGMQSITEDDVKGDLTLFGIVGLIDPPRKEAIEAVRECRQAGIRVKMITGDHALTASAIGKQLGIGEDQEAVTGADLEQMSDDELVNVVWECDVFARTSPEHKLRLVEALQKQNAVVAMTGDGVNDAPALKRADVGVAMGIKGAEASKDASDMVLADDNFATIAHAVREGRTIYDNLKKTILFILPTNGAEALLVLAAILFAFTQLPITPVQILWVNMVTAVTLALALAFEPTEPGVMRRPPRDPDEPILSGYLIWRISFVSVLIGAVALTLFFRELGLGGSTALAQTTAVNVLAACQFAYLFNSRFIRASALSVRGIIGNPYALAAGGALFVLQVCFTYVPVFQLWFGTEGLPFDRWIWINGAALTVFLLVEMEKAVLRWVRPEPEGRAQLLRSDSP
ncbi:cation-transporting P-type ATPase [soil metagenome]